jgi:hypothetical protein
MLHADSVAPVLRRPSEELEVPGPVAVVFAPSWMHTDLEHIGNEAAGFAHAVIANPTTGIAFLSILHSEGLLAQSIVSASRKKCTPALHAQASDTTSLAGSTCLESVGPSVAEEVLSVDDVELSDVEDGLREFAAGDVVEARDCGREWFAGVVTQARPTMVILDGTDVAYEFDEVRFVRCLVPAIPKAFCVGETVDARDHGREWLPGVITQLSPLKILLHGTDTAYVWDEVRPWAAIQE